jgi:hypothetical protein
MESIDLKPYPGESDARLDAMLRRLRPPLPDIGFSSRVLTALPPAKKAPASFYRLLGAPA